MIGALISAGASLAGGLINRASARDANAQQNAIALQNMEMQQKFAQMGIRWRVKDAEAAGIHPLYALGAQTTSFSPVSVGTTADTSLGSAVASMGQDISRAMNATRTGKERDAAVLKTAQDLELTGKGLQNELLAAQIAKLKASINPPMPDGMSTSGDTRSLQIFEGAKPVTTPKVEATQEKISDEYGDEGLPTIPGNVRFVRDWLASKGYDWSPAGVAKAVSDGLLWIDRNTSITPPKKWR